MTGRWDVDHGEIDLLCWGLLPRDPTRVELRIAVARLMRADEVTNRQIADLIGANEETVESIRRMWYRDLAVKLPAAAERGEPAVTLLRYQGWDAWRYRPAEVDAAAWRGVPLHRPTWVELNVVIHRLDTTGRDFEPVGRRGEHVAPFPRCEIARRCGVTVADLDAVLTVQRVCQRCGDELGDDDMGRRRKWCTPCAEYQPVKISARYAESLPHCECGCGEAITEVRRHRGARTASALHARRVREARERERAREQRKAS